MRWRCTEAAWMLLRIEVLLRVKVLLRIEMLLRVEVLSRIETWLNAEVLLGIEGRRRCEVQHARIALSHVIVWLLLRNRRHAVRAPSLIGEYREALESRARRHLLRSDVGVRQRRGDSHEGTRNQDGK